MNDAWYMTRALRLAANGLYTTDPNPRVGCVIVRNGQIVGEGWHARAGEPHAEVNALIMAGERARGATAYITLEPCCHHGRTPPCTDALLAAGVTRVVVAMEDPNPRVAGRGYRQLREAGVEVVSGLLETEARALNPGFVSRMARGRPFVRLKLAMSLDGRTALADGESRWITGEAARADVQLWRARAGAVLTGVGTVLADDPRLDVRLTYGGVRQPMRVVLDSALRTPLDAQLISRPGRVLLLTAVTDPARHARYCEEGVDVMPVTGSEDGLDLGEAMRILATREINELHVECGARLAGSLLRAGLVDEFLVYMAPVVLGSSARGLFEIPALADMASRPAFDLIEHRCIGGDLRLRYRQASVSDGL